ncbi:hypothetical protein BC828DRAFT_374886 [Blastocladiella britannica]|nr:hypothetical protein BC828DRAFT_374886 [Blastocladiella britannica]
MKSAAPPFLTTPTALPTTAIMEAMETDQPPLDIDASAHRLAATLRALPHLRATLRARHAQRTHLPNHLPPHPLLPPPDYDPAAREALYRNPAALDQWARVLEIDTANASLLGFPPESVARRPPQLAHGTVRADREPRRDGFDHLQRDYLDARAPQDLEWAKACLLDSKRHATAGNHEKALGAIESTLKMSGPKHLPCYIQRAKVNLTLLKLDAALKDVQAVLSESRASQDEMDEANALLHELSRHLRRPVSDIRPPPPPTPAAILRRQQQQQQQQSAPKPAAFEFPPPLARPSSRNDSTTNGTARPTVTAVSRTSEPNAGEQQQELDAKPPSASRFSEEGNAPTPVSQPPTVGGAMAGGGNMQTSTPGASMDDARSVSSSEKTVLQSPASSAGPGGVPARLRQEQQQQASAAVLQDARSTLLVPESSQATALSTVANASNGLQLSTLFSAPSTRAHDCGSRMDDDGDEDDEGPLGPPPPLMVSMAHFASVDSRQGALPPPPPAAALVALARQALALNRINWDDSKERGHWFASTPKKDEEYRTTPRQDRVTPDLRASRPEVDRSPGRSHSRGHSHSRSSSRRPRSIERFDDKNQKDTADFKKPRKSAKSDVQARDSRSRRGSRSPADPRDADRHRRGSSARRDRGPPSPRSPPPTRYSDRHSSRDERAVPRAKDQRRGSTSSSASKRDDGDRSSSRRRSPSLHSNSTRRRSEARSRSPPVRSSTRRRESPAARGASSARETGDRMLSPRDKDIPRDKNVLHDKDVPMDMDVPRDNTRDSADVLAPPPERMPARSPAPAVAAAAPAAEVSAKDSTSSNAGPTSAQQPDQPTSPPPPLPPPAPPISFMVAPREALSTSALRKRPRSENDDDNRGDDDRDAAGRAEPTRREPDPTATMQPSPGHGDAIQTDDAADQGPAPKRARMETEPTTALPVPPPPQPAVQLVRPTPSAAKLDRSVVMSFVGAGQRHAGGSGGSSSMRVVVDASPTISLRSLTSHSTSTVITPVSASAQHLPAQPVSRAATPPPPGSEADDDYYADQLRKRGTAVTAASSSARMRLLDLRTPSTVPVVKPDDDVAIVKVGGADLGLSPIATASTAAAVDATAINNGDIDRDETTLGDKERQQQQQVQPPRPPSPPPRRSQPSRDKQPEWQADHYTPRGNGDQRSGNGSHRRPRDSKRDSDGRQDGGSRHGNNNSGGRSSGTSHRSSHGGGSSSSNRRNRR